MPPVKTTHQPSFVQRASGAFDKRRGPACYRADLAFLQGRIFRSAGLVFLHAVECLAQLLGEETGLPILTGPPAVWARSVG